jgi:hypothetical protein
VLSKTNRRSGSASKWLSRLAILLLLVVVVVGGLELTNTTHFFHTSKQSSPADRINYGPATPQEQADSESHKDASPPSSTGTASSSGNTSGTNTAKKSVTVEITTYRQHSTTFDVNSQVTGVVETGGTCTLSMIAESNPSESVTQSRLSEANASNTTCGVISVPLSKLHSGTWNVSVSYSSSDAQGKSDINQLEVN